MDKRMGLTTTGLPQNAGSATRWPRLALLALILLAFGRVLWQLDAKNFWWDESLSLQRAEQPWLALLRGELVLQDGFSTLLTIDQHPFFSFLLQGILIRLAGESELVVRFPAAAAATLLPSALWVLARRLSQRHALPPSTPLWAALLAAISPFYLWYGQEARPYALWALLAVLSTYLLLRALTVQPPQGRNWAGYGVVLLAFLATHYLAVFLIPLHALIVFQRLAERNLRRALIGAGVITGVGGVAALVALWQLIRPGAGDNLDRITLRVLLPDLLNAFSLGLSVNINEVWLLDLLFGALALLGAGWAMRNRGSIRGGGWIAPLFVLLPVGILLMINLVRPAYMNARHLSLISGGFLLLVAGGLGVLTQWRPWLGGVVALPLVIGVGYSTVNYFTLPQYGKDDYAGMGAYLREQLLPGDLLLLNPPSSWRIFDYYLPLAELEQARVAGVPVAYFGVPLLNRSWEAAFDQLAEVRTQYRRIWHANSGTHPYFDPENQVEGWLGEHTAQFKRERFFSPNSILALDLYLPGAPVHEGDFAELPVQERVDVRFGTQIYLVGYDIGRPIAPGFPWPLTLYWQVTARPDDRYKHIVRLLAIEGDRTTRELTRSEREPYDGVAATNFWDPGKTIIEYVALPTFQAASTAADTRYALAVQLYHAESLEKLPVTLNRGAATLPDGETILLPLPHFVVPGASVR
jgi:4-amino-4-deoxy-L-arabinose transferase-like glycosyltransferase